MQLLNMLAAMSPGRLLMVVLPWMVTICRLEMHKRRGTFGTQLQIHRLKVLTFAGEEFPDEQR